MEAVTEKKKKTHHGRNIRIARTCQNITQEDLAFRTNLSQSKVSALELEETIEDSTLEKFASALSVPVNFLKNFEPQEVIKSFTITDNTFNNNPAENSNEVITQGIVEEQNNTYYPINKVTELYERLLEKEKEIAELKSKYK